MNHPTKKIIKILFLLAIIILAPLSKLLSFNWDYFTFSLLEICLATITISALLASLSIPILKYKNIPDLITDTLSITLIITVIFVYIIPTSLAVVDGANVVDFIVREEASHSLTIAALLSTLIFITAKLKKPLYQFLKQPLSILTLLSSLYVIGFTAYAISQAPSYFSLTGSGKEDYKLPLSSKKNIFIIGFDQVQGSLMRGLLEKNPDLASVFDGFKFFTDAASTYPNTNYSLSSIMLGRIVEKQSENYKIALESPDSLLHHAKKKGYSIYTSSFTSTPSAECLTCPYSTSNKSYNWPKIYESFRHALNISYGFDLNSVVSLPKPLAGIAPQELLEHAWKLDLHTFEGLARNITIEDSNPSLYFMHFSGTHQPFTYDSKCNIYSKESMDSNQNLNGALESAKCAINLLNTFINELKKANLYDSSSIIIYSDHGYEMNINNLELNIGSEDYFKTYSKEIGDSRNIKPMGSYNPTLLYKAEESTGHLKFSDEPVSLIDISPTICESIECSSKWQGQSLNENYSNERQRDIWMYIGGPERRSADGKDKLHDGLEQFWQKLSFKGPISPNLALAMSSNIGVPHKAFALNEVVEFYGKRSADPYLGLGWGGPELTHTWTVRGKASLKFRVQDYAKRDLLLRLNANAYLGGGLPHQKVGVEVNGTRVAEWQVTGLQEYNAVIPAHLVGKDGLVNLVFDISEPRAPCDYSESKDCRKLGIAIKDFTLDYNQ